jgi:hypothetical protein
MPSEPSARASHWPSWPDLIGEAHCVGSFAQLQSVSPLPQVTVPISSSWSATPVVFERYRR